MALKKLLDDTNANVRALENTRLDGKRMWDLNLVYLVTQNLDADTRKLWEQHSTSKELQRSVLSQNSSSSKPAY